MFGRRWLEDQALELADAREKRQRVAQGEDRMRGVAVRDESTRRRGRMPSHELPDESAHVLLLRSVAHADAVVAHRWPPSEQELDPDRRQIESRGDGKRERAVHTGVEVDQPNLVSGADELKLEGTAPADRAQQLRHGVLEPSVARDRDCVSADPAIRRGDPQSDLMDGADELALPRDSGAGCEPTGEN